MLKRLIQWGILLLPMLVACGKTEPTQFLVSTPGITSALTQTLSVNVTCDYIWKATLTDHSWGTVSVEQTETGGTVTLTLGFNTGADERRNTLILTSGSQEIRREIIQRGTTALFGREEVLLQGTIEQVISFNSPVSWQVRIAEGADWMVPLTQVSGTGAVSVTIAAQDEFIDVGERTGAIEFTFAGNTVVSLPVRQGQTDTILLSGSQVVLDTFDEEVFEIATSYNVDYTVSVNRDWLQHVETKALKQGREVFHADANETPEDRTATITVSGGGISSKVQVVQMGRDPILTVTEPGAYGVGGEDYAYSEGAFPQLSRMYGPDGSFLTRLINPESGVMVQLSGFTLPSAKGDAVMVLLEIRRNGLLTFHREWDARVIYENGDRMWIKANSGDARFVVKL